MSLIGIRDMSVINTAPNDRLPIHTCVEAWDANLIREAVERAGARARSAPGADHRKAAAFVGKLVPRVRSAWPRQMPKHELEES